MTTEEELKRFDELVAVAMADVEKRLAEESVIATETHLDFVKLGATAGVSAALLECRMKKEGGATRT